MNIIWQHWIWLHVEAASACIDLFFSMIIICSLIQKAFLFRYVIEHRDQLDRLFTAYDGIIRAFTFEQLQNGVINEDIAVLYDHYLTKEAMTPRCQSDAGSYFQTSYPL